MMECPVSADSLYHRWQQIVREESADAAAVGLRLRLPGRDEAFCLPDSLTLARATASASVMQADIANWRRWLSPLSVVTGCWAGQTGCLRCFGEVSSSWYLTSC